MEPCPAEFEQSSEMEIPCTRWAPVTVLHHPWGKHFYLLSNQNFPGCSLASHLICFCRAPLIRLCLCLLCRFNLGSGKLQLGCPLSLLQAEQTCSFQPLHIHHIFWTPDHNGSLVNLLHLSDQDWNKTRLHIRCDLMSDKHR